VADRRVWQTLPLQLRNLVPSRVPWQHKRPLCRRCPASRLVQRLKLHLRAFLSFAFLGRRLTSFESTELEMPLIGVVAPSLVLQERLLPHLQQARFVRVVPFLLDDVEPSLIFNLDDQGRSFADEVGCQYRLCWSAWSCRRRPSLIRHLFFLTHHKSLRLYASIPLRNTIFHDVTIPV
jgi:hypothetical protein